MPIATPSQQSASGATPDTTNAPDSKATAPFQRAPQGSGTPIATAPMVNADYLDNSPPTYPPLSRRMGEQGTVLVRALISSSGVAIRVETIQTSGYGRLDRAALEAVSRWRFVAAHVDGVAVEAWVTIPVRFELDPL